MALPRVPPAPTLLRSARNGSRVLFAAIGPDWLSSRRATARVKAAVVGDDIEDVQAFPSDDEHDPLSVCSRPRGGRSVQMSGAYADVMMLQQIWDASVSTNRILQAQQERNQRGRRHASHGGHYQKHGGGGMQRRARPQQQHKAQGPADHEAEDATQHLPAESSQHHHWSRSRQSTHPQQQQEQPHAAHEDGSPAHTQQPMQSRAPSPRNPRIRQLLTPLDSLRRTKAGPVPLGPSGPLTQLATTVPRGTQQRSDIGVRWMLQVMEGYGPGRRPLEEVVREVSEFVCVCVCVFISFRFFVFFRFACVCVCVCVCVCADEAGTGCLGNMYARRVSMCVCVCLCVSGGKGASEGACHGGRGDGHICCEHVHVWRV